MSIFFLPKHSNTIRLMMAAALIASPEAYSRTLLPGESEVVTNPPAPEAWVVSQGGTLTVNNATALTIASQNANVVFNGGQSRRIDANTSSLNMTGATVNSAAGRGAIQLLNSNATINNSTITSTNSFGLLLGRNINTPASSSATVSGNSVITGVTGGVNAVGFAVLNLTDSTVVGTGATSYGVQLGGATLSATGSTITGAKDGLQIVTDSEGVNASTVTLDNTRVNGGTGSAIVLGSSARAGTVANINVSGNSELIGGDGSVLKAINRSTANFNVDGSTLAGDVNAETGSTVALLMQNGATLNGNLQNVTRSRFDTGATLNGNVEAVAGTAATVSLDNGSAINGNVDNVASLSLNNGSTLTGNVTSDANGSVLLDNSSVLTGQINNSANLTINNAARWVMTDDSTVQQLGMNNGVVQMGTNEQFQRLNVGNLTGNGTFVMGTDLGTGSTDFLNVTGTASGHHQLLVSATGTTPVTAEPVQVGNIAAGTAAFALANKDTVDAGTFVYRLKQEGQGLYLTPDKETVSTSANTALALAGSARSVLNAEMNMLSSLPAVPAAC
jgi:hypothetical protein